VWVASDPFAVGTTVEGWLSLPYGRGSVRGGVRLGVVCRGARGILAPRKSLWLFQGETVETGGGTEGVQDGEIEARGGERGIGVLLLHE